jgi:hypothetical protein
LATAIDAAAGRPARGRGSLKKTRFSGDGKSLTFGVENSLLKEEITAHLKRKGVPDASFSKELVKLPVETFVEFLDEIVDDDTKRQVRKTSSMTNTFLIGATRRWRRACWGCSEKSLERIPIN